ncbi:peptidase U61, LD-carboxypeptidase A [Pelomyxa schiedti]|nr:peptidase U61, LD-carboxypeptidase A [Pelomyxa schiedti]
MRASDVMEAFSNSSVNAIIANRGGYGCPRILDLLDYDVIAQNPKPLVGYSDLTALIIAVYARTGMVTFHGPMGIDDWVGSVNSQYFSDVIMQGTLVTFQNSPDWQSELYTINKGKARGKLIGGNLSLLTAMIGWQYLTADLFKGAILFLEDVDEPVYSLDRMMRQLELAGFFDDLAGIVWGVCSSCDASPRAPSDTITLREMLEDYIVPLHIPAYYGAMFGHIDDMWTLPIGVEVELDADAFTVTMLERILLNSRILLRSMFRVTKCLYARDQFVTFAVAAWRAGNNNSSAALQQPQPAKRPRSASCKPTRASQSPGGGGGGGGGVGTLPWPVVTYIGQELVTRTERRVAFRLLCDEGTSPTSSRWAWVVAGMSGTTGVTDGPWAADPGPNTMVCGFLGRGRSVLVKGSVGEPSLYVVQCRPDADGDGDGRQGAAVYAGSADPSMMMMTHGGGDDDDDDDATMQRGGGRHRVELVAKLNIEWGFDFSLVWCCCNSRWVVAPCPRRAVVMLWRVRGLFPVSPEPGCVCEISLPEEGYLKPSYDHASFMLQFTKTGGSIARENELCMLRKLSEGQWSMDFIDLEKSFTRGKLAVACSILFRIADALRPLFIMNPSQGGRLFVFFATVSLRSPILVVDAFSGSPVHFPSSRVHPAGHNHVLVEDSPTEFHLVHIADLQHKPLRQWSFTSDPKFLCSHLGLVLTYPKDNGGHRNTVNCYDSVTGCLILSLYVRVENPQTANVSLTQHSCFLSIE